MLKEWHILRLGYFINRCLLIDTYAVVKCPQNIAINHPNTFLPTYTKTRGCQYGIRMVMTQTN